MRAAKLVARELGNRLSDPTVVRTQGEHASRASASGRVRPWSEHSLAQGFAGIACAFAELDVLEPGEQWDRLAHSCLASAVRSAEAQPLDLGLFGGLSGLLFATSCLSQGGLRYRGLRDALQAGLEAALAERQPVLQPHGISTDSFDVISGASGVIACLLAIGGRGEQSQAARLSLELIALAGTRDGIPNWFTPARFQHGIAAAEAGIDTLNYGLAHGAPGPIAALALVKGEGLNIEGAEPACHMMVEWLLSHRCDDESGINWPAMTKLDGSDACPTRSAWCYGAPGIACSLALAGRAFGVAAWDRCAIETMEAVYRRPIAARRIDSPTFCHGIAGLLQITTAFLRETREGMFARQQESLVEQVIASFETSSIFGVRSIDAPGLVIDRPGFLDGSAGTLAALASACTGRRSAWERAFLIS